MIAEALADGWLDARLRRHQAALDLRVARRREGPLLAVLTPVAETMLTEAQAREDRLLAAMERAPVDSWDLGSGFGIVRVRVERTSGGPS